MPEASKLALIREDIDRNSGRIKSVLRDERIRREFLKGISDEEATALKAFADQNKENALKSRPKVRPLLLSCEKFPCFFPNPWRRSCASK